MLMENVKHVTFATEVLCSAELRFSLLAASANCPGISSLLSSLAFYPLPPSTFDVDMTDIVKVYELSLCNSFYEVRLDQSPMFAPYKGRDFLSAAADMIEKKICFIGVKRQSHIYLNPVSSWLLHEDDICLYISSAPDKDIQIEATDRVAAHGANYHIPNRGECGVFENFFDFETS